ncbi:radical SAM protein [Candidatus Moduliflexota bacterium]
MGLEQFDIQKKILWHHDRVHKWLKGDVVYPITMEIDPTNTCNEKCIWCCWENHRSDNTTMSRDLMEKIIEDLAEVGVRGLIWTGGGEPLLNKHTPHGIKMAKSRGMENGMFTNGICMTPDIIPLIVENCAWVRVSLGAATRNTFNKCHRSRGENDFYRIVENVKEFVRVKKEMKSQVAIGLSMMVHHENYHELYQEACLAKDLEVDYFQGKPLNQNGSENVEWWKNRVVPLFKKAKNDLEDDAFKILTAQYTQDKYGDEGSEFISNITPSLCISDEQKDKCYVHNFVTAVTAGGDVAFCKNLRDKPDYIIGNLKQSMMKDIYAGERRMQISTHINAEGCASFCQNGRLNQMLKFIVQPDSSKHPCFL